MDKKLYTKCLLMASEVGFLTELWETTRYATALYHATLWGEKKTLENKKYFSTNHLIDKYNV